MKKQRYAGLTLTTLCWLFLLGLALAACTTTSVPAVAPANS